MTSLKSLAVKLESQLCDTKRFSFLFIPFLPFDTIIFV